MAAAILVLVGCPITAVGTMGAGAGNVEAVDNKLVISLQDPEASNPEIIKALVMAGAQLRFVGEIRHSLEQIYLEMVKSTERGQ